MAGCGENEPAQEQSTMASPATEVGSAVDAPAEVPEATETQEVSETAETTPEVTEEPTEAPAPTEEVVVEDNPNIIDGVDFTSFNAGGTIRIALSQLQYDEPKIVVTRKVMSMSGQEISAIGIMSNGEHYVEEEVEDKPSDYMETDFTYYIYAPKNIKNVTYNKETITIDSNGEGRTTDTDHLSPKESDEKEIDGVMYPKLFYFGLNDFALVTNDEVTMNIEYEDGTSDQMTIYITKEHVEYGN